MPNAKNAPAALPILNAVAEQYEINNERRMAAWLATLAVESGELKYKEEIASGDAYDTRTDLGNTPERDGDGRKFKGHGPIQITGKDNHRRYTNYLKKSGHLPFVDFLVEPKKLAQEPYATDSAGWFWTVYKGLNKYADIGDFLTTQIRVNGRNKRTGKPNHWSVRNNYWVKALSVLPDDFTISAAAPDGGTAQSLTEPVAEGIPSGTDPRSPEQPPTLTETTKEIEAGPGGTTASIEEKTTSFSPDTFQQYIPKMKGIRNWFGTLSLGGIASTTWAAFNGLPPWAVFCLGMVTSAILIGFAFIAIRYRANLFDLVKHAISVNADPTTNNVELVAEK